MASRRSIAGAGDDRRGAMGFLCRTGWLSTQAGAVQQAIENEARVVTVDPGRLLWAIGDTPGGIHAIVDGVVLVHGARADQAPVLAHVLGPGSWFGEGPFANGGVRHMSFRTRTAATLLQIPLVALGRLRASSPVMAHAFTSLVEFNLRVHYAPIILDLLEPTAERRIAATLLRCAGGQPDCVLPITQTELGEMANVSRHHVNRTLTAFEERGWIETGYQRIALRAPQALASLLADAD